MSQRTTEHQTKVCANANEHQAKVCANVNDSISYHQLIETLIKEKVLNENDELYLSFSKLRINPKFPNRRFIEDLHYSVSRVEHIVKDNSEVVVFYPVINIDEEVKKVLPTVRYIDFSVN